MKIKNEYSKRISFEGHKLGLYDLKTFIEDWSSEPRRGVVEKRCRIVKKKGEKVLEITIPKGTRSNGGSFWRLNFPRNLTDATFEYDIMFGDNFDFVRGGKLPGLGGGTSPGSKKTEEEYQNGFSARLMWRQVNTEEEMALQKAVKEEIAEILNSKESYEKKKLRSKLSRKEITKMVWLAQGLVKEPHKAYLVQYMYYPDRKTNHGDDQIYKYKNKNVFVEPNKWYNIKMRIKLSEDPKKKDTLFAWVNGKKVLDRKLNLRKKKSFGINQIMFSLFFGGDDDSWITTKKEKVYFRKFVVNGN